MTDLHFAVLALGLYSGWLTVHVIIRLRELTFAIQMLHEVVTDRVLPPLEPYDD